MNRLCSFKSANNFVRTCFTNLIHKQWNDQQPNYWVQALATDQKQASFHRSFLSPKQEASTDQNHLTTTLASKTQKFYLGDAWKYTQSV